MNTNIEEIVEGTTVLTTFYRNRKTANVWSFASGIILSILKIPAVEHNWLAPVIILTARFCNLINGLIYVVLVFPQNSTQ